MNLPYIRLNYIRNLLIVLSEKKPNYCLNVHLTITKNNISVVKQYINSSTLKIEESSVWTFIRLSDLYNRFRSIVVKFEPSEVSETCINLNNLQDWLNEEQSVLFYSDGTVIFCDGKTIRPFLNIFDFSQISKIVNFYTFMGLNAYPIYAMENNVQQDNN